MATDVPVLERMLGEVASVIEAVREIEALRGRLAASEEARSAAETAEAARVAVLEQEIRENSPARLKAEKQAASLAAEMAVAERRIMEMEQQLAVSGGQIAAAELARSEAERHEGMFRRALFVYLQERDGPAGTNAPTPETLALIRDLINGGS